MADTEFMILDLTDFSETEYAFCLSLMTEQRKRAVNRFHFPDDRKRTVAGELLAKRMLSDRCGIEIEKIVFDRSEKGKPFAVGLSAAFSVSHSGALVLCAVSSRPVGADIEKHRSVNDRLIRYACAQGEWEYVTAAGISDDEKQRRFFRVWTGKEAYYKYTGTGITSMHGVDIFNPALQSRITYFQRGDYAVSLFCESEQPPSERHSL